MSPLGLFFNVIENSVGLRNLFLWFGFHHFAQPKSHPVQYLGHRTGRGQLVRTIPLRSQGCQRRLRRQARIGQGRTKRWVLLRVRFRQLPQGGRGLGLRVFPAFATAEGRLRPETSEPCTSFGKPHLNSMTPPTEDGFGQQGVTPTIFQGHLSLKGTSCWSRHFGGRQAEIGDLGRTKRLLGFSR